MMRAFISLGSNLGNRKELLQQTAERISFANKIINVSNIYETVVKDGTTPRAFLNCCIEIETDMGSQQLLQFLLETQRQMGHEDEDVGDFSRVHVDCDLIAFGDEVIRTPVLTLPHPSAHRRAFIMIPMAEIAPHWVHPVLNKTAKTLAEEVYWPGWGTFYAPSKTLLDF